MGLEEVQAVEGRLAVLRILTLKRTRDFNVQHSASGWMYLVIDTNNKKHNEGIYIYKQILYMYICMYIYIYIYMYMYVRINTLNFITLHDIALGIVHILH